MFAGNFFSLPPAPSRCPPYRAPPPRRPIRPKPITIVVPFAAGGPTATIGAPPPRLRASLGQPVLVESATGAGGTIGVGRAARAAPDGYTISLGHNGSHVVTGATYTTAVRSAE